MTNSFKDLSDSLCGCGWYLFPIDVQKMLPTICVAIQQPVVLMCYGNVLYTRETFKKVIFNYWNFELYFNPDESKLTFSHVSLGNFFPSQFRRSSQHLFKLFALFQIVKGGFSIFMVFRQLEQKFYIFFVFSFRLSQKIDRYKFHKLFCQIIVNVIATYIEINSLANQVQGKSYLMQ